MATACPDHGPVARAIVELRRVQIPGYDLGDLVGVGNNGAVWAGSQNTLVKVARVPGEAVFAQEIALFTMLDGRVVPKLLATGLAGNTAYMVVQRPPGRSLAHDLERGVASLDVIAPLARAIDELHRAGIIHGDLKPENIYVAREPAVSVMLVDLGNARRPGAPPIEGLPFARERGGTPHYLAPEQVPGDNRPLNFATDVYAFGAICFEILCGRPPFIGTVAQVKQGHAMDRPPRPSQIANVDPRYDAPILRCLAKDVGSRFASPRAAVEILARIISGTSNSGSSPGITPPRAVADERSSPARPPVEERDRSSAVRAAADDRDRSGAARQLEEQRRPRAGSQIGEDDEARPFAREEVYPTRARSASQVGDEPKPKRAGSVGDFARDEVYSAPRSRAASPRPSDVSGSRANDPASRSRAGIPGRAASPSPDAVGSRAGMPVPGRAASPSPDQAGSSVGTARPAAIVRGAARAMADEPPAPRDSSAVSRTPVRDGAGASDVSKAPFGRSPIRESARDDDPWAPRTPIRDSRDDDPWAMRGRGAKDPSAADDATLGARSAQQDHDDDPWAPRPRDIDAPRRGLREEPSGRIGGGLREEPSGRIGGGSREVPSPGDASGPAPVRDDTSGRTGPKVIRDDASGPRRQRTPEDRIRDLIARASQAAAERAAQGLPTPGRPRGVPTGTGPNPRAPTRGEIEEVDAPSDVVATTPRPYGLRDMPTSRLPQTDLERRGEGALPNVLGGERDDAFADRPTAELLPGRFPIIDDVAPPSAHDDGVMTPAELLGAGDDEEDPVVTSAPSARRPTTDPLRSATGIAEEHPIPSSERHTGPLGQRARQIATSSIPHGRAPEVRTAEMSAQPPPAPKEWARQTVEMDTPAPPAPADWGDPPSSDVPRSERPTERSLHRNPATGGAPDIARGERPSGRLISATERITREHLAGAAATAQQAGPPAPAAALRAPSQNEYDDIEVAPASESDFAPPGGDDDDFGSEGGTAWAANVDDPAAVARATRPSMPPHVASSAGPATLSSIPVAGPATLAGGPATADKSGPATLGGGPATVAALGPTTLGGPATVAALGPTTLGGGPATAEGARVPFGGSTAEGAPKITPTTLAGVGAVEGTPKPTTEGGPRGATADGAPKPLTEAAPHGATADGAPRPTTEAAPRVPFGGSTAEGAPKITPRTLAGVGPAETVVYDRAPAEAAATVVYTEGPGHEAAATVPAGLDDEASAARARVRPAVPFPGRDAKVPFPDRSPTVPDELTPAERAALPTQPGPLFNIDKAATQTAPLFDRERAAVPTLPVPTLAQRTAEVTQKFPPQLDQAVDAAQAPSRPIESAVTEMSTERFPPLDLGTAALVEAHQFALASDHRPTMDFDAVEPPIEGFEISSDKRPTQDMPGDAPAAVQAAIANEIDELFGEDTGWTGPDEMPALPTAAELSTRVARTAPTRPPPRTSGPQAAVSPPDEAATPLPSASELSTRVARTAPTKPPPGSKSGRLKTPTLPPAESGSPSGGRPVEAGPSTVDLDSTFGLVAESDAASTMSITPPSAHETPTLDPVGEVSAHDGPTVEILDEDDDEAEIEITKGPDEDEAPLDAASTMQLDPAAIDAITATASPGEWSSARVDIPAGALESGPVILLDNPKPPEALRPKTPTQTGPHVGPEAPPARPRQTGRHIVPAERTKTPTNAPATEPARTKTPTGVPVGRTTTPTGVAPAPARDRSRTPTSPGVRAQDTGEKRKVPTDPPSTVLRTPAKPTTPPTGVVRTVTPVAGVPVPVDESGPNPAPAKPTTGPHIVRTDKPPTDPPNTMRAGRPTTPPTEEAMRARWVSSAPATQPDSRSESVRALASTNPPVVEGDRARWSPTTPTTQPDSRPDVVRGIASMTPESPEAAEQQRRARRPSAHVISRQGAGDSAQLPAVVAPLGEEPGSGPVLPPVTYERTALLAIRGTTRLAIELLVTDDAVAVRDADPIIYAFPARDPASGVRAAIRIAQRLPTAFGVVHCTRVAITERGGELELDGEAIVNPVWALDGRPERVAMTVAAAEEVDAHLVRTVPTQNGERLVPGELVGEDLPEVNTVGRDDTIAALHEIAIAVTGAGRPVVRIIEGASGTGKTRVLRELEGALAASGLGVWWCAPDAPVHPIVTAVARACDLDPRQVLDASPEQLGAPLWAALQVILETDQAPRALAPSRSLAIATVALGHAIRDAARRAPIAILVDDAHRIEPLLLDALEIALAHGAPIFAAISATPGGLDHRPLASSGARVTLAPLDEEGSTRLALDLLMPGGETDAWPPELVREIVQRSGGNPRALFELAQELRSTGAFRRMRNTRSWSVGPSALEPVRAGRTGSGVSGIAARMIARLPEDLTRIAHAVALGGGPNGTCDEALATRVAAELGSSAPGLAIERLVQLRVLARSGKKLRFHLAQVRDRLLGAALADERLLAHAAFVVAIEQPYRRPPSDSDDDAFGGTTQRHPARPPTEDALFIDAPTSRREVGPADGFDGPTSDLKFGADDAFDRTTSKRTLPSGDLFDGTTNKAIVEVEGTEVTTRRSGADDIEVTTRRRVATEDGFDEPTKERTPTGERANDPPPPPAALGPASAGVLATPAERAPERPSEAGFGAASAGVFGGAAHVGAAGRDTPRYPATGPERTQERDAALARHLRGAGRSDLAAPAFLALAERAIARQRYGEAEEAATEALAALDLAIADAITPEQRAARTRARIARAHARGHLGRVLEALDDAQHARAGCAESGDVRATAHASLEECALLDRASRANEAAAAAIMARTLIIQLAGPIPRADDPERDNVALRARLAHAEGRALARIGRHRDAKGLLGVAIAFGAKLDTVAGREVELDARLLLAAEHVALGAQDAAETELGTVFAYAHASNDLPRVAAAHIARALVRAARRDLDAAEADLLAAIELARELRDDALEYRARYHRAELLIWRDRLDDAAASARRAFELCSAAPIPAAGVLLARVAIARADTAALETHLTWIASTFPDDELAAEQRVFRDAGRAFFERVRPQIWDRIVQEATTVGMQVNARLELFLAALAATADAAARADLRRSALSLTEDPGWRARLRAAG